MNKPVTLDAERLAMGETIQARRTRIGRWWHHKLHEQWESHECVRGVVTVNLAFWGGVLALAAWWLA